MVASFFEAVVAAIYRVINRRRVWYRLPFPIAVINLLALRVDLRRLNLFDTETAPLDPPVPIGFDIRHCRTADGTFNDLSKTWMGMADARFGRNVPIAQTFGEQPPELYEPNPRLVSRDLLARRSFVPVTTVNLFLGVAAIHGARLAEPRRRRHDKPPLRLPLPTGDDWPSPDMTILRTLPDDRRGPRGPGSARDLSQHRDPLVGRLANLRLRPRSINTACAPIRPPAVAPTANCISTNPAIFRSTRSRDDDPNLELAGVNGNWWIGLSVLHTLFAREHNAIVDRLRVDYPDGRRRMAVPESAARQRRPHRQDPHRRMDAGAAELAGRAHGHARQLLGPARRALRPRLWPARRRRNPLRHPGLAHRITMPRRTP